MDVGCTHRVIPGRDKANIIHDDCRKKHLHDIRGTFATRLILAGFTDEHAADVLGWSPTRVAFIRKTYVDQERVVVAMGERLRAGTVVNQSVNRQGGGHTK